MDYVVDITVIVKNGKEKSTHLFKNESIKVSRATKLWIQNNQDSESNFYETLKMWHGIDKNTKTQSYLTIQTSQPTQIESFRKYYIEKIDEEDQAITFNWVD